MKKIVALILTILVLAACSSHVTLIKKDQRVRNEVTLGIAAPASAFDTVRFEAGLSILRQMGFKLTTDKRIFDKIEYLAGSDETRAAILQGMFLDAKVDAIMCARGGYGSVRMLDLLDLAAIANHKKPLVGFSDITALFCALYPKGVPCYHGPVVVQMGDLTTESIDAFIKIFEGASIIEYSPQNVVTLNGGKVTAPMFGGNLAVLASLVGTNYFPDLSGHILFLEDLNEQPYRIDRMLTQLAMAVVLDKIAGVVMGEFTDCGDVSLIYARLMELLAHRNIPVLVDFPAGHGSENLILPLGVPCEFDADEQSLRFYLSRSE